MHSNCLPVEVPAIPLTSFVFRELMHMIKQRIKHVMVALPQESTATNIMRHILKVVREEYEAGSKVVNKNLV